MYRLWDHHWIARSEKRSTSTCTGLPPPFASGERATRTGLVREPMTAPRVRVNLERLIRSCEVMSGEIQEKRARRRFETYLSVLQRYWHELAATRCSEEVLGEYRRKIEYLADLLDDDKLLAGGGAGLARSQAANSNSLTREEANAELQMRLSTATRIQEQLRSQLMQHVDNAVPIGPPTGAAAIAVAASGMAALQGSSSDVAGAEGASVRSAADEEELSAAMETQR